MEEVIITEQIDSIVVGSRKMELMRLLLGQETEREEEGHNQPQYIYALNKLLGHEVATPHNTVAAHTRLARFTKVFLTRELWLHLHFFLHDNRLFDPFIFEAIRGGIPICIFACDHAAELAELKKLLHRPTRTEPLRAKSTRIDLISQAKILSKIHQPDIEGFASVLALQITSEGRIIQESSNLRLTPNQVSRWVVDRHFKSHFNIKVKDHLYDQIEFYDPQSMNAKCHLI